MWIELPTAVKVGNTEYKYKVVKSKNIILNLNNGSVKSSYAGYRKNIGDDTVYCFADSLTLPTADEITRDGFYFDGWYDNAEYTGQAVTNATEDGKTYYAKWIEYGTIHYENGIYDGFVPYWKVGAAPTDDKFVYNSSITLPGSSNFTNVGYKLAGWTTTKPTDSTATKEYDAGAELTVAQTNDLYNKRTNGKVILYAVWERDLTQIAWNENMDKVYTSEENYEYRGMRSGGGGFLYNQKGAQYALGAAITLMNDHYQTVYVLQDADLYIDSANYAEIEFTKISTLDGGVYSAKVNGDIVTRNSSIAPKGKYSGFSSNEKIRLANSTDNRYTVNRVGGAGGHGIQTYQSGVTMKNLIFTYNGTNSICNGFFSVNVNGGQHSVTLDNVKLSGFLGNSNYPMFLTRTNSTDTYTLKDCEITGNNTGSGSVFYVGVFGGQGTTKLILKGNTIITGNIRNATPYNLVVSNENNLTFADDFTGKVSVYLPSGNNMIAALCSTEDRAKELLDNSDDNGQVISDQNYRLTAEKYINQGAIRVARPAKIIFSANNATSGKLPDKTKVGGVDTAITNGILNVYYGDSVVIPGAGTITKSGSLFKGWNTRADGLGGDYKEGDSYVINSDSITLYAKWVDVIAEVNHDGTITGYETLQKAVDVAAEGDTVKLCRNTVENITVVAGKDFTLDLNGNVLKGTGNGRVIIINSNAKLMLVDNNPNTEHRGTVENNLWMNDDSGNVVIKGGIITGGNTTDRGAGVYVNGGTFIMTNGTITGNKSSAAGGGVSVISGNCTMDNVTISYNVSTYGGAIDIGTGSANDIGKANVTVKNSKISNNYGINNGGGINNNDTLRLENCEMKNNIVTGNDSYQGGGAIFQNFGSITVIGGVISDNYANIGGGIRLENWGNNGNPRGTVTFGGDVVIAGNYEGEFSDNKWSNQVESNVYISTAIPWKIIIGTESDVPKAGMSVGLTTADAPTADKPIELTGNNGADYSSYFTGDNSAYAIRNVNNVLKLMKAGVITNNTPEVKKSDTNGYITIDKVSAFTDETVTVTVVPNTAYTLSSLKYNDGTDHDIIQNTEGLYVFTMPAADVTVTAAFEHNHSFTCSVDSNIPNVLKATCIEGCPDGYYSTPHTLTLVTPTSLLYDGNAKEATIADAEKNAWTAVGLTIPDIVYTAKLGNTLTNGLPVNVGNYTASITVNGQTAYLDFKIAEKKATIDSAPTAIILTYNGEEQVLVSEGTSNDGKLQYRLGTDGTYGDSVPTAMNADTYTVYYKVVGDNNHVDSDEDSVEVTISLLNITGATVGEFEMMTYNGSAQTPLATVTIGKLTATGIWSDVINVADTTGFTANGNFIGTIDDVDTGMLKAIVAAPSIDSKIYNGSLQKAEIPASELYNVTANEGGTEVGSYDVELTLTDAANYKWSDTEDVVKILNQAFVITKNGAAKDIPTAKTGLVYNGAAQELIYAGISEDGHYEYSLSETGDYSTAIPVGTNSDSYTVWYIFNGDANHDDDLIPKSLTVQIALRPVKVIARDNSKGLNLTDPALEYYTEGSVDTYPLTGITVTREAGEAAGTYAIIPAIDKSAYPEYDITLVNGVFTIGEHIFDRQVPDSMYLCHESTCTSQATYYYSCECGACGTAVFSYGSTKSHITSRIVIKDATTEEEGIAEYRCIHCSFSYQVPLQKLEKPATTPTPEVTPEPTDTPAPTREPEPTDTPTPTKGAEPTDTPAPTKVAEPTDTPKPTKGAEPTATPTPIPEVTPLEEIERPEAGEKDHETLLVTASSAGENAIELNWTKMKSVDYYIIYGAECNKRNEENKLEAIAQVGKKTTAYTVTGLKKASWYKFNIDAYKDGILVKRSVLVRAVTDGGKYTNAEELVLKTLKNITMQVGDELKVEADVTLDYESKKYYKNVAFRTLFRLESSDKSIAKVRKGVIYAKKLGKVKIYVYAQNGEYEVIEVEVKKKTK